ncbi:tyrosine-type recombinase/integrase [Sphingomonas sp. So64.6b]|uniref:tyrosine-type recombinase/integrase n=1 Tax=Sphingomonas sp. So64.6b TaxID=2997354 RepID=UPI0015FF9B23|nr:integrase arm-type DNA-binding domain-containing protein [Sphingomonas sp. So64.6b]QNA87042.1 tyrosine-type recombinase/integrase [Sphingomonas sp. So64.6b]
MLTQLQITSATPRAKPYNLPDGQGLVLVVQTSGSKLWRFRYRYAGRPKTLHIGPWPAKSLADAREKCREARKAIAAGLDPVLEKKRARITARFAVATTFKDVALEWVAKCEREGRAEITVDKIRWLLGMAYPLIGSHPIGSITPTEALSVLRKVEARGRYESARRMRSVLSRVFRYGIATARCDRDIAADLRGALTTPKTVHHAAITDPDEVGILLKTMDGYTGQAVTRMAMRLSPHLFVRPGELRQAEWGEIDVEKATWSIPAERMKMRRAHRVPLSRQVLAMIEELRKITGHRQHLFPCMGSPRRPMSENGVNQALRRLGYETGEMTAHGFRAMAATLLNEMGQWNPDAIERQLAHQEASSVRRAYARGEYWDERVAMMQHWSDYLDGLRDAAEAPRPPKISSGTPKARKSTKAGRPRGRPAR